MNRKDFFRKSCQAGFCACAGLAFMNETKLIASSDTPAKSDDWRVGFMQFRMAKLTDALTEKLDSKTCSDVLEQMGKACSKESEKDRAQYSGNLEAFLKDIQEKWVEKATYDKEKGEIKIVDRKREACFCPFVSESMKNKEFCNCSKGWQKQTYESIIGKPVEVSIDSSILRGSDRCSFTIKIQ